MFNIEIAINFNIDFTSEPMGKNNKYLVIYIPYIIFSIICMFDLILKQP